MQRVSPTLTKIEISSATFQRPRPNSRKPHFASDLRVGASLRRHSTLAFLVCLGIVLAGASYAFLRYGHSYYAESAVYVSPVDSRILTEPSPVPEQDVPYDPRSTQAVDAVTRRDILVRAIGQLPNGYLPHNTGEDDAAALAGALQVERVPNSSQVRIGLHGDDAKRITDIVNAVTTVYLDTVGKEEFSGRSRIVSALRSEQEQIEKDLAARRQEQTDLDQQLGIATADTARTHPYVESISRLSSDLVDARDRLHVAEAQMEPIQSRDANGAHPEAGPISTDTDLNRLKQTLLAGRAQIVAAMSGMAAGSPERQQNQSAIAEIDRSLAQISKESLGDTTQRRQEQYRANLLRARDDEARISHDLAATEAAVAVAAPTLQKAQDLAIAIQQKEERLHTIETRLVGLDMENNTPGNIRLMSAAQQPVRSELQKSYPFLLLLVPFALLAGTSAAVLRDLLDPTVHSPHDIERTLGLPPVGVLFDRSEVSQNIESEYVFRLGASLDHAHRTANVRSIAFTAVRSGAGTTTIVNLVALELAQLGNRVLVLDAADMREPVAFIPPEQDNPHGNPRPRMVHAELDLSVQSRGRNLPGIGTVANAFRRAHWDFDILLLDCAPLLVSADTEYNVRHADATLLIAEAGATRKPDLLRSTILLDRLRVPGLAVVLNRLQLERADKGLRNDIEACGTSGSRRPAHSPLSIQRSSEPAKFQALKM